MQFISKLLPKTSDAVGKTELTLENVINLISYGDAFPQLSSFHPATFHEAVRQLKYALNQEIPEALDNPSVNNIRKLYHLQHRLSQVWDDIPALVVFENSNLVSPLRAF